jgi:hypothetical protein
MTLLSFFGLGRGRNAPRSTATDAPTSYEGRLTALEASVTKLSQLPIEWAEVLDKVNRWASREAQRQRRELQAAIDLSQHGQEVETMPNGEPIPPVAATKAELWARLRKQQTGG